MLEHSHPSYQNDTPYPSSMNIGNLGSGRALTSDTYNGAWKTRRLIVEKCHDSAEALHKYDSNNIRVLEVDYWNHLRNVWIGGIKKAMYNLIGKKLREELYEINSRLRSSTSIESVIRAINKEFSLCDNYPKGHGELFCEWIETYHPGALLRHIDRASGYCQYLAVEGEGVVYVNRPYWIEFLDKNLQTPGYNILQENIFIILSPL